MMEYIKVQNVYNENGKAVANQYLIFWSDGSDTFELYQSYQSSIILWKNGLIQEVYPEWCYSKTTGKYRNMFTGLTLKKLNEYIKENMSYNCDSECWELNQEVLK